MGPPETVLLSLYLDPHDPVFLTEEEDVLRLEAAQSPLPVWGHTSQLKF